MGGSHAGAGGHASATVGHAGVRVRLAWEGGHASAVCHASVVGAHAGVAYICKSLTVYVQRGTGSVLCGCVLVAEVAFLQLYNTNHNTTTLQYKPYRLQYKHKYYFVT